MLSVSVGATYISVNWVDKARADYEPITTKAGYFTLPTPTRSGYTFTGWTLSGGGLSESTYTFGATNGTVTAQWKLAEYIFNTRYESNILNWIVFILFFGWV